MSTSSWAFAAVFSQPERPSLIRGWADFSYSRNMWCVWLENLDLDFEFATTYEIQKWFLHWETRLCISFYLPSFENWPKKLLSRTAILHEHTLFVAKTNTKKYIPFIGFPNETVKEIHEIRIWIFLNWNPPWGWIVRSWNPFSEFIAKSEIGISERKSKFSNRKRPQPFGHQQP